MKTKQPEEKENKTTNVLDSFDKNYIQKLMGVGFTEEQAKVLLEIIETKVFSGGVF